MANGKHSKVVVNQKGLAQLGVQLTEKWADFCARMAGQKAADIASAYRSEWGGELSEEGAGMLSRGERVDLRM